MKYFYVLVVFSIISCEPTPRVIVQQPQQEQPIQTVQTVQTEQVQILKNGNDQIVIIKDNDGSDIFMNYLIWSSLMGIDDARRYHHTHYNEPAYKRNYSNYKTNVNKYTVVNNITVNKSNSTYQPNNVPVQNQNNSGTVGKFKTTTTTPVYTPNTAVSTPKQVTKSVSPSSNYVTKPTVNKPSVSSSPSKTYTVKKK